MKKTLFYVSISGRGCGLRAAKDEDAVRDMMAREAGTDNIQEIREATDKDIDWVKGMGGRVPQI